MMKTILTLLACMIIGATQAQQQPPFYDEIQAFKKQDAANPPAPNSILFVGSSSFRLWHDVQAYFPGYPILNRGFGGSSLPDVIRYAPEIILPYKPKQVVIYCENDLPYNDTVTPTMVVQRFITLFGIIRQGLPKANISFVSIKPSPSRANLQEKVKVVNSEIKAFLKKQKNTHFIDIYDAMLDANKQMRPELFIKDRLHMNADGYAIWQKIITPYLKK